jgi:hypothetical protein
VGNPTERLFRALAEVVAEIPETNPFHNKVTLKKQSRDPWISSPEARLLQRVLSESLTVDQHTFADDFFSRYIRSVFGAEDQIESAGNHIVFGRRGSGKSSLLVYAMRRLEAEGRPYAWVSMQTYDRRGDHRVIASVLVETLDQALAQASSTLAEAALLDDAKALRDTIGRLAEQAEEVTLDALRLTVPKIKRIFVGITRARGSFTIFLDDFHVIAPSLQPELLSVVYAFTRGNKVYLKLSAIEHFARTWDPVSRTGLETPNDAQRIGLDYNLTIPDKARDHISKILSAHATYSGLPSVAVLCRTDAMARLVWVAAGVPRDATSIFAQAMVKAVNRGEKEISVTSINVAASEAANDKMRFVEMDTSGAFADAVTVLDQIKTFCIREQKKNAFIVQVKNDDPMFESIRKLIDLRLLHVLHPGITPDEAGVKWMAVLLDYGFYTGMRAAKSIDLFQAEAKTPEVKELRKLPRFNGSPERAATLALL